MLDSPPLAGARHSLGLRVSQATGAGRRFNAPGTIPTLILRGVESPRPTLADRARRLWAALGARLGVTRRTTTYGPSPSQPRVYRVHLLAPARGPAMVAPPCYTAVAR